MHSRGYDEIRPDGAGYDKVDPSKKYVKMRVGAEQPARGKPRRRVGSSSGRGDRAEGDQTVMFRLEASNISKVNLLMTILAIITTLFIFCVIGCVVVILHHARIVEWFPALTQITGDGFEVEIGAN
ncbi:hypothetical protein RB195_009376 [Necator americanus]